MEKNVDYTLILAENREIETVRLLLRPITLRDAEDVYEYSSDEETVAFVFPLHQSLEDTRKTIAEYFMKEPLGKYGIELKETGKLIGTIDLRIEERPQIAEIGYAINKQYWGKGYVPEAAEALLDLGFEKLKLIRIFAVHDERNPKSGRVMNKLGMKIEGHIPSARIWKGEVVNDVLRGITRAEWDGKKK